MKKKSSSNIKPSQVRIIGGLWRGRKLPVLDQPGLRPTTDRVKETLFNWLMLEIVNANCLDSFAGTGSLGIEALSRQAKFVLFLEKNLSVSKQLKQNLSKLDTRNAKVINTDTLKYLQQENTLDAFDIVFIDPPFNQDLVPKCIDLLEKNSWLAINSLIYIEAELDAKLVIPTTWQLLKEKSAGQVKYLLFTKIT